MENMEQRVEDLTQNVHTLMSSDMVKDMVLRALICACPDRAIALRALEAIWADHQYRMREVGFAQGHNPKTARDLVETQEKDMARWTSLLAT